MGIKLLVTCVQANEHRNVNALELDESTITIGRDDRDSVKLDPLKLQGCRAGIKLEHNTDTGLSQLRLTNLSGSAPIHVNHQPLPCSENTVIDFDCNFRMGDYLISASIPTGPALAARESEEFSLDSAIRFLLKPGNDRIADDHTFHDPSILETEQNHECMSLSDSRQAQQPLTVKPFTVHRDELPVEKPVQENVKTTPTVKVVTFQAPIKPVTQSPDNGDTVLAESEQTLIECMVGVNDIQQLDFEALRLFSISGRILHHEKPIAGIKLEGGNLGNVVSDANGCFCFENIIEGTRFQIHVKHDGYQLHGKDTLCGVLSESIEVKLSAIKLSRVSGRLTHKGQPLQGIRLDAGVYGHCVSDKNGFYHFDDIPENTNLTLLASRSGFAFKQKVKEAESTCNPGANTLEKNAVPKSVHEINHSPANSVDEHQAVA